MGTNAAQSTVFTRDRGWVLLSLGFVFVSLLVFLLLFCRAAA